MAYADKTLTCRECGRDFSFTASEQEFYASRGLQNEPGRCPECRAARKAAGGGRSGGSSYGSDRGGGSSYGGSSRGSYGDSGGSSYGSSSGGGGGYGSREPRQMYTAVCSSCGGEAQVPFQPTSGKPVYCRDCFAKQRSSRY
jgi:CxxC-x17-CxxC domain-containing protein